MSRNCATTPPKRHFQFHNKSDLLDASLKLQQIQGSQGPEVPRDWYTRPPKSTPPPESALQPSHSEDFAVGKGPEDSEIINALAALDICFSRIHIEPPQSYQICEPSLSRLQCVEPPQSYQMCEPSLSRLHCAESTAEPMDPEIYGALKRLETSFRMRPRQPLFNTTRSLRRVDCTESRVCKRRGGGARSIKDGSAGG